MRRLLAASVALALAGCGGDDAAEAPEVTSETASLPGVATLSPEQTAALESRDCRTVVEAYSDALRRRAFTFAARFWDDPVIDDARLEALFHDYSSPTIDIVEVREEGAAGSLYCTVTGALIEGPDPTIRPRQGKIVLRRANDVPGATPEQLRWTIESSTFLEPMERAGKGEPA